MMLDWKKSGAESGGEVATRECDTKGAIRFKKIFIYLTILDTSGRGCTMRSRDEGDECGM